jgi:hypothetical protein
MEDWLKGLNCMGVICGTRHLVTSRLNTGSLNKEKFINTKLCVKFVKRKSVRPLISYLSGLQVSDIFSFEIQN